MHITIWEFHAIAGREAEFEQSYGPDGEWARLFRRGEGYLGTELLRDEAYPRRYITLDRWTSPAARSAFQGQWRAEYNALDKQCEALTEHEAPLGVLTLVAGNK